MKTQLAEWVFRLLHPPGKDHRPFKCNGESVCDRRRAKYRREGKFDGF